MPEERWRCFVSVPLPDPLRTALATAAAGWRLRDDLAGMSWTDPAGWHVTLAFLGGTEPDRVPDLMRRLAEATAGHRRWLADTGGLGGFPSASRARVAWYGVADPDRTFVRLAADVRHALRIDDGSRFRAHVTLGRARRDPVDLREWIATASAPEGHLDVAGVELMRSHLGRGPARYETLAVASLGGPHGR